MFAPQKLRPVASHTKHKAIIIQLYVFVCKHGAENEPLGVGMCFMNAIFLYLVVIVWVGCFEFSIEL